MAYLTKTIQRYENGKWKTVEIRVDSNGSVGSFGSPGAEYTGVAQAEIEKMKQQLKQQNRQQG